MNKDSFNISITFKSDTALLNLIESTCQKHFMSRSELIRAGIRLMIQKLASSNTMPSDTSNPHFTDVSLLNDDLPSADMFGTSSPSIDKDVPPIDDLDVMFPPSIYPVFNDS